MRRCTARCCSLTKYRKRPLCHLNAARSLGGRWRASLLHKLSPLCWKPSTLTWLAIVAINDAASNMESVPPFVSDLTQMPMRRQAKPSICTLKNAPHVLPQAVSSMVKGTVTGELAKCLRAMGQDASQYEINFSVAMRAVAGAIGSATSVSVETIERSPSFMPLEACPTPLYAREHEENTLSESSRRVVDGLSSLAMSTRRDTLSFCTSVLLYNIAKSRWKQNQTLSGSMFPSAASPSTAISCLPTGSTLSSTSSSIVLLPNNSSSKSPSLSSLWSCGQQVCAL